MLENLRNLIKKVVLVVIITNRTIPAVSYTHLDVYKRQLPEVIKVKFRCREISFVYLLVTMVIYFGLPGVDDTFIRVKI